MIKLNIGCGPLRIDGEIGIDLYQTAGCDVQADVFQLPFVDESIDFVRLDHVMEHQEYRRAVRLLSEVKRVLRYGGRVKIGLPDIADYCRHFLEAIEQDDISEQVVLMRGFYGSQAHAGEYHKSGWSREMIRMILQTLGFRIELIDTEDRDEGYCFMAVAIKQP